MKLAIAQIILADASFRHVGDFLGVKGGGPVPQAPVSVEVRVMRGEELDRAAIELRVKIDDPNSRYALNVSHMVLFVIDLEGKEAPKDFEVRLMVTGAHMAYPYVRESVSSLTAKGRFGPIWLAPMDANQLVASAKQSERVVANA